jgi:hypothetical protein
MSTVAARYRLPALITALAVVVTAVVMLLVSTVNAQSNRTVEDLTLASAEPGQLTISWSTPGDSPTDYRIMWARDDLEFPSWRDSNEQHRANDYPSGNLTEHTLAGLTPGENYKVKMRSRYRGSGGGAGPWTGVVRGTVMENPLPPPPPPPPTPEPTIEPTPTPEPTIEPTPTPTLKPPKKDPTPIPDNDRRRNAPTDITLVGNMNVGNHASDSTVSIVGGGAENGQAFTTGLNGSGYILTGVTVRSDGLAGHKPTLIVCPTDDAPLPIPYAYGCYDLDMPSSFAINQEHTFTVPHGETIPLDPNATYMLIFGRDRLGDVKLDGDAGNGEDGDSLSDWSIRNVHQWEGFDNDPTTWPQASNNPGPSIQIRLTGFANPPLPLRAPINLWGYVGPDQGDGSKTILEWDDSVDRPTTGWQYRSRVLSDTQWDPDWTDHDADKVSGVVAYSIANPMPDVRRTYEVRALRDAEIGPGASTIPLMRPTNLRGDPGNGEVTLNWDTVDDPSLTGFEYAYRVEPTDPADLWNETYDGWAAVAWTLLHNTTSHTVAVPELDNGLSYDFVVRGVHGNLRSYPSDILKSAPKRPPMGSDNSATIEQNGAHTFTAVDFGFMPSDTDSGDTLQSVQIMTLPTRGRIVLSEPQGTDERVTGILAGQSITIDRISDGELKFKPFYGTSSAAYTSFTFKVTGTSKQSVGAYTMAVNVAHTGVTRLDAGFGSGSVKLTWINAGDDSIEKYQFSEDGGSTWANVPGLGAATSHVVEDVSEGSHTFQVRSDLVGDNYGEVVGTATVKSEHCLRTIYGNKYIPGERVCLRVSDRAADRIEAYGLFDYSQAYSEGNPIPPDSTRPVGFAPSRWSMVKIIAYRDASMERYPLPPDPNAACASPSEECWLGVQSVQQSTRLDYECRGGDDIVSAFMVYDTRYDRKVYPDGGGSYYEEWRDGVKLDVGCTG